MVRKVTVTCYYNQYHVKLVSISSLTMEWEWDRVEWEQDSERNGIETVSGRGMGQ